LWAAVVVVDRTQEAVVLVEVLYSVNLSLFHLAR
jgi:hypothetical protein